MDLPAQAPRVDDCADVADAEIVDEPGVPRFDVHLDFRKTNHKRVRVAVVRVRVFRDAHQAKPCERLRRGLRERMDVLWQLVAVVLPAQLDGAPRRLRVADASRRIAFAMHALAAEHVVGGRAAEIFRRDFLQLEPGALCAGHIRPRHRMRRLAADREARPWHAFARVAPRDLDLLPRHRQHFGGDSREIHDRVRAQIAASR